MKTLALLTTSVFVAMSATFALAEEEAGLIKNAESAAPPAVAAGATIYAPQADGSM